MGKEATTSTFRPRDCPSFALVGKSCFCIALHTRLFFSAYLAISFTLSVLSQAKLTLLLLKLFPEVCKHLCEQFGILSQLAFIFVNAMVCVSVLHYVYVLCLSTILICFVSQFYMCIHGLCSLFYTKCVFCASAVHYQYVWCLSQTLRVYMVCVSVLHYFYGLFLISTLLLWFVPQIYTTVMVCISFVQCMYGLSLVYIISKCYVSILHCV